MSRNNTCIPAIIFWYFKAFIPKSFLIKSIISSLIALLFGLVFTPKIAVEIIGIGCILATVFTIGELYLSWSRSSTWRSILILPIEKNKIFRSLSFTSLIVASGEILIPIAIFLISYAQISTFEILLVILLGAASCIIVLAVFINIIYYQLISLTILAAAITLLAFRRGELSAALLSIAAVAVYSFPQQLDYSNKTYRKLLFPLTVLREIFSKKSFLANTIIISIFAALFTRILIVSGITIPIGLLFAAINSPLATVVSRSPDSLRLLKTLPRQHNYFIRYALESTMTVLAVSFPSIAVHYWLVPSTGWQILVSSLLAAVIAGIAMAALERYLPITKWRSEREVLKHPRKYLIPISCLFVILLITAVLK